MVENLDNGMNGKSGYEALGLMGFGDDVRLTAKRQREEMERVDALRAKATEEVEKKRERIQKGKAEFEEALK